MARLRRPGRGAARHFNPVSGAIYRGLNHLMLSLAASPGSCDSRWLTLSQIEARGMSLAPGAKAGLALFAKRVSGCAEPAAYAIKGCSVFQAADAQGLPRQERAAKRQENPSLLLDVVKRECEAHFMTSELALEGEGGPGADDVGAQAYRLAGLAACGIGLAASPALMAASIAIAAFLLLDMLEVEGGVDLPWRAALAEWRTKLAEEPRLALRAARMAEDILSAVRTASATWSRRQKMEDARMESGLLREGAAGDLASQAQIAARAALKLEVSLFSPAELENALVAAYGCQDVLPQTNEAIHRDFAAWAGQAIEAGALDGQAADAEGVFLLFLQREALRVEDWLARDEAKRRQCWAESAIDMPRAHMPALDGEKRRVGVQPLRDANGEWLGVVRADLIASGLSERIEDGRCRMGPERVYLIGEDAQRFLQAAASAGWELEMRAAIEADCDIVGGYAAYYAPLAAYAPAVGDRLRLASGEGWIEARLPEGDWLLRLECGRRQLFRRESFHDHIEAVIARASPT
ncbi:ArdC family protein [Chromobacterium sp. IIBBL 290-4]|nr:ArdC family protein [Chromobacterium sp. IIBBL 290-4]UTH74121.1 ArdC family protein [Chromobacterium sp. IIBBL 290-4]